jgi:hypothetical protein
VNIRFTGTIESLITVQYSIASYTDLTLEVGPSDVLLPREYPFHEVNWITDDCSVSIYSGRLFNEVVPGS